ncbi:4911_t:CDS:2 [Acaulospora morrowiae]|uniref:4911_t:CDS:1 n=1 Tax=Acaulospora morrowiae TaxID=94023 RepID=A0A9N9BZ42_9GLOM|nr:4911_t:CDS:2 [Acaulospora morrowiae]
MRTFITSYSDKNDPIVIAKLSLELITFWKFPISKFTNTQIQTIIDHFTKKPDIEFTDEQNNSSDDLSETEVSIPTESILLDSPQENDKDSELLEVEVSASSSDIKKTLPEFERLEIRFNINS